MDWVELDSMYVGYLKLQPSIHNLYLIWTKGTVAWDFKAICHFVFSQRNCRENAKLLRWVRWWLQCRCFIQCFNRGRAVAVEAQLNECTALYLCVSSHVHVCGAYICLPEASVLNSLSMCDESSGWEKSSALHGLSRPLTNWILKRLSICQGFNSSFALPLSRYLIYLALYLPLCVHRICLCIFFFISLLVMNRHDAECGREMQQACETDKKTREHPPLVRLSS